MYVRQDSLRPSADLLSASESIKARLLKLLTRPTIVDYYSLYRAQEMPVGQTGDDYAIVSFVVIREYPIYNFSGYAQEVGVEFSESSVDSTYTEANCVVLPNSGVKPSPGDIIKIALPATSNASYLLFRVTSVVAATISDTKALKLQLSVITPQALHEMNIVNEYIFSYNGFIDGSDPLVASKNWKRVNQWKSDMLTLVNEYVFRFMLANNKLGFEFFGNKISDDCLSRFINRWGVLKNGMSGVSFILLQNEVEAKKRYDRTIYQYVGDGEPLNGPLVLPKEMVLAGRNEFGLRYAAPEQVVTISDLEALCSGGRFKNCTTAEECAQVAATIFRTLYFKHSGVCEDTPDAEAICGKEHPEYCLNADECYKAKLSWWKDEKVCKNEPEPDCGPDALHLCSNSRSCESAGGYFYDEQCHALPRCHPEHPWLCESYNECKEIAGYWFNDECHMKTQCELFPETCINMMACLAAGHLFYDGLCHGEPDPVTNPADVLTEDECFSRGFVWENGECRRYPSCHSTTPEGCLTKEDCEAISLFWQASLGICASEPEPLCDADHLEGCDETRCLFHNLYFWNNECHAEPPCHESHVELCLDETTCVEVGGYFYNGVCNKEPECRLSNLAGCKTQEECEAISAFFFLDECHAEPPCHESHVELCLDEPTCLEVGGYFYNGVCNKEPELICSIHHPELCMTPLECNNAGNFWNIIDNECQPFIKPPASTLWRISPVSVLLNMKTGNIEHLGSKILVDNEDGTTIAFECSTGVVTNPAFTNPLNIVKTWKYSEDSSASGKLFIQRTIQQHTEFSVYDGGKVTGIVTTPSPLQVIPTREDRVYINIPSKGWYVFAERSLDHLLFKAPDLLIDAELFDVSSFRWTGAVSPGYLLVKEGPDLFLRSKTVNRVITSDASITKAFFMNRGAVWVSDTGVWFQPDVFTYLVGETTYSDPVQLFTAEDVFFSKETTELILVKGADVGKDKLLLQHGHFSALYDLTTALLIQQLPDRVTGIHYFDSTVVFATAECGSWQFDDETGFLTPFLSPEHELIRIGKMMPSGETNVLVRKEDNLYMVATYPSAVEQLRISFHNILYPEAPPVVDPPIPIGELSEEGCEAIGQLWLSYQKCVPSDFISTMNIVQQDIIKRVITCQYTEQYLANEQRITIMDLLVRIANGDNVLAMPPDAISRAVDNSTSTELFCMLPLILKLLKKYDV